MAGTTIHMGVSVRGAIAKLARSRARMADGYCDPQTGRPLRREEAIDALMDALASGAEVLPLGDCPNWSDKDGCQCWKRRDDAP